MKKQAYISSSHGVLTLVFGGAGRNDILVMLEFSIPDAPSWVIRVPYEPGFELTILRSAVTALAEDFLYYLIGRGVNEDLCKVMYASVTTAFESLIRQTDAPVMDGGTLTLTTEIPVDEVFVGQIYDKVVLATSRSNPIKPLRKMEVTRKPPRGTVKDEAMSIIQKYRNRSLKGIPNPLYVVVYNMKGKPVGVKKL